uniref:Post-GPI attachment to proteins GalNAc transferase 4 n=1 Tax=Neogobius melanostomus TaxID=47308 RepID=A0A8C6WSA9_9GOBI
MAPPAGPVRALPAPVYHALLLCLVTFGLLLPLCCHRLVYSYYYIRPLFLDSMSESALRDSLGRGLDALHFWEDAGENPELLELSEEPELLVTIVTARRSEAKDFHYLLQVARRLNELLSGCEGKPRCADVLICDVERGAHANEDAALLEKRFKVVRRGPKELDADPVNIFEREKRDYVFCLRKGLELTRAKNVLVLEDDALPSPDFFSVVYSLLSRSLVWDNLYVKLYHPERLQRYWNPEPSRILEWVGLGSVLATALLLAAPHCKPLPVGVSLSRASLLFFTLYFMATVELFGRHYLLELRRLSPQLYVVSPATECCTPAMLFPGNASLRAADLLDAAFCSKGNAKDMVLYGALRTLWGEHARSLEPNLVSHIGPFLRQTQPRRAQAAVSDSVRTKLL